MRNFGKAFMVLELSDHFHFHLFLLFVLPQSLMIKLSDSRHIRLRCPEEIFLCP